MCELFGLSSAEKVNCNELLRTFFSHGETNPDGWGLALFDGNSASIEKEPISSAESVYLKHRLSDEIVEDVVLAHIRKASKGGLEYRNCHPFKRRDASGRLWTLIHNGTIFESALVDAYIGKQHGGTDSERILYYLIDQIDAAIAKKGGELTDKERFDTVNQVIRDITPENKVNLLIYDGDLFYAHTNFYETLFRLKKGDTLVVATKPLTDDPAWEKVPMSTPLAYRKGRLIFEGEKHPFEFIDKVPRDSEYNKPL